MPVFHILLNLLLAYTKIFQNSTMHMETDHTELCQCKCHFGGAVSCPRCKDNHGIVCCHCKE